MIEGTRYGARLKRIYAKFRPSVPAPVIPEADDPLHRLGIAILGVACGDAKAERAVDNLLSVMVDWNEVRISNAREVNRAMGNGVPDGLKYAQRLIDALVCIFQHENQLSLDRLNKVGRREAREYLERLDGVDEFAVASVLLWSLGGHAIPVDDKLLKVLRDADLVHPTATRAEVQAFLERHVGAADAKEFCLVMRSYPADKDTKTKRGQAQAPVDHKTKKKA
jgi:endonuclease III